MSTPRNTIIDNIIKNTNPFTFQFVDQNQLWGTNFLDVPEINAHVSDEIFDSIDKVTTGVIPSTSIVIIGDKGLGKTQIIRRIRHHLQSKGEAFFVYMGSYGHLDYIKSEFLQTLTASFQRISSEGVTQWQDLAANMYYNVAGWYPCSPKELASGKFASDIKEKPTLPDTWTNAICRKHPELNNHYMVRAIFWTLSETHQPYATRWLAGHELIQKEADQLGLPRSLQNNESAIFKTICELLSLIGNYKNLVLCFDELDSTSSNTNGFTRAQVVAEIVKDLRHNNIGKCIFLLPMYGKTLSNELKLTGAQGKGSGAAYDRIADKVLELEHLNPDTSVLLVCKWLTDFYKSKKLSPSHSLYPFDESRIRKIGAERPTARQLLKWCCENWNTSGDHSDNTNETTSINKTTSLKDYYQSNLHVVENSIDWLMENNSSVGLAIYFAFTTLIAQEVDGIKILEVEWIDNSVKAVDNGYLHCKITAKKGDQIIKIGVAAILNATGKFVGAALKRLIDYKKFEFTRACLVRAHKISNSAGVARKCLKKLLEEQDGEWITLQEEDIKPLLALKELGEMTECDDLPLHEFIHKNRLVIDNALIRKILRNPSSN